jgi:hypothetical protein
MEQDAKDAQAALEAERKQDEDDKAEAAAKAADLEAAT